MIEVFVCTVAVWGLSYADIGPGKYSAMAHKVTSKQHLFATLVGSAGLSLSEAYKQSYQAEKMKPTSIAKEASRLAANPHIAPLIEQYSQRRKAITHSHALSQAVSDKDKVLNKLRHLADHGESQDQTRLRATVELGRTCGVFQDTVEIKSERSSEDILAQLQAKLDQIKASQPDSDSLH